MCLFRFVGGDAGGQMEESATAISKRLPTPRGRRQTLRLASLPLALRPIRDDVLTVAFHRLVESSPGKPKRVFMQLFSVLLLTIRPFGQTSQHDCIMKWSHVSASNSPRIVGFVTDDMSRDYSFSF